MRIVKRVRYERTARRGVAGMCDTEPMRNFARACTAALIATWLTGCAGAGSTGVAPASICNGPLLILPQLVEPGAENATGVSTAVGGVIVDQGRSGWTLRLVAANGAVIDGGTFGPANTVTIDPSKPYYQASVPTLAPNTKYTVHVIGNRWGVIGASALPACRRYLRRNIGCRSRRNSARPSGVAVSYCA